MRKKADWFLVVAVTLLLCAGANAQSQPPFAHQVRALEQATGGRLGVMAKNLATGEVLAYRATEKFPTASLIKLPVLVEYFYQIQAGKVSPNQKVRLTDENKWGGSGLLQFFQGSSELQLSDAAMLMITISDNTATNLVLDALGNTHAEKLAAVNQRMLALGLKNTRLLNKLMSWATKTDAPESVVYGVGVSTPEDMVLLLEKLARGALVDSSSCAAMLEILENQQYNDLIPRLLPFEQNPELHVAHKTGSVTGVQTDAGLVFSDQAHFALAIFIENALDRRDSPDNETVLAGAQVARLVWNHFTGDRGFERPFVSTVNWTAFPGGEWAKVALKNSPYPHSSRQDGYQYQDKIFPVDPHYNDSSAVIVIPDGFSETEHGANLIIHFHGWNNDVLNVLEQFNLAQQLIASGKNAVLVLAQGPYRASDSGGGKMEDEGGLKKLVGEILEVLCAEKRIGSVKLNRLILTAHSGGYRPAILSVARGGLQDKIREVYLFDAFYALSEELLPWLKQDQAPSLRSIFTDHLAPEHDDFKKLLTQANLEFSADLKSASRITLCHTSVGHNEVIDGTFLAWLKVSCLENRTK